MSNKKEKKKKKKLALWGQNNVWRHGKNTAYTYINRMYHILKF